MQRAVSGLQRLLYKVQAILAEVHFAVHEKSRRAENAARHRSIGACNQLGFHLGVLR